MFQLFQSSKNYMILTKVSTLDKDITTFYALVRILSGMNSLIFNEVWAMVDVFSILFRLLLFITDSPILNRARARLKALSHFSQP